MDSTTGTPIPSYKGPFECRLVVTYPPDTVNKQDIDFGHGEVIKAGDIQLVQRVSTLGKNGIYNHEWLLNFTQSALNRNKNNYNHR